MEKVTAFKISFNEKDKLLLVDEQEILDVVFSEENDNIRAVIVLEDDQAKEVTPADFSTAYRDIFEYGYGLMGGEEIYVFELGQVEGVLEPYWNAIQIYQHSLIEDMKLIFDNYQKKLKLFQEKALLEFSDTLEESTHIYGETYLSSSKEDYMSFSEGYRVSDIRFETLQRRSYPLNRVETETINRQLDWELINVSLDGMFNSIQFNIPKDMERSELLHLFKKIKEMTGAAILKTIADMEKNSISIGQAFSYAVVTQTFLK